MLFGGTGGETRRLGDVLTHPPSGRGQYSSLYVDCSSEPTCHVAGLFVVVFSLLFKLKLQKSVLLNSF